MMLDHGRGLWAAMALAVLAASASYAEPAVTYVEARVRLADLDLSSAAGIAEMQARIAHAASKMCGGGADDGVAYPDQARAYAACRRGAVDRATREAMARLSSLRAAREPDGDPSGLGAQARR